MQLLTAQKSFMDPGWDNLFKSIVTGEWALYSDGDVESPSGYFALVPIEESDLRDSPGTLFDTFRDEWPAVGRFNTERGRVENEYGTLPTGFYITVEDSAGFIFVYHFADRVEADTEYYAREALFAEWDSQNDV